VVWFGYMLLFDAGMVCNLHRRLQKNSGKLNDPRLNGFKRRLSWTNRGNKDYVRI